MANPKMICPECSTEMNHHADKWIERSAAPDGNRLDTIFGGFIEEVYGCPSCGAVQSRREE